MWIQFSYDEFNKSLCPTIFAVGFHFVPPKPDSLYRLPVSPARLPVSTDFCIAVFFVNFHVKYPIMVTLEYLG